MKQQKKDVVRLHALSVVEVCAMLRQFQASSITACVLGLSAPAFAASLSDLPVEQRATAECMSSVMSAIPEITEARLIVSGAPSHTVFVAYQYRHKDKRFDPVVASNQMDITAFVEKPHEVQRLALSGLSPTPGSLDDANLGMLRISRLWERKCGLKIVVVVG